MWACTLCEVCLLPKLAIADLTPEAPDSEPQLPWAHPTPGTTTLRPGHVGMPAQSSGPQLKNWPTSECRSRVASPPTGPCTDQ